MPHAQANDDENIQYRVEASYLEIYMEKIRDLFNPKQSVPSLKVRWCSRHCCCLRACCVALFMIYLAAWLTRCE